MAFWPFATDPAFRGLVAVTMKPALPVCLSILSTTLTLWAEPTPEEWCVELRKNYASMDGFRATYTAVSPTAEEPLHGFILEDRKTGACFVQMLSDSGLGGRIWWLPPGKNEAGGAFAMFGNTAFQIQGLGALMQAANALLSFEGNPSNLSIAPVIHLGAETISVFLTSSSGASPPAVSGVALARVEETRELSDSVEFILPDGSWIRLQKTTGLLAGQGYPSETGERSLLLNSVEPLGGLQALRREIPDIAPDKLHQASAEELQIADALHATLFQAFVSRPPGEAVEPLNQLLADNRKKLSAYWLASWGRRPPPGIPAEVIKAMQNLEGQKRQFHLEWTAARKARPSEMKDVSFSAFFRMRRMKLRQDLRKKIEMEAGNLPAVARLQTLLDGEISKLAPGQVARGRALAAALVQSQRDAMVMAILPLVPERRLDKSATSAPEFPAQD